MSENKLKDLMSQFVLSCGDLIHDVGVLNSNYTLWRETSVHREAIKANINHTFEVIKNTLKELNTLLKNIEETIKHETTYEEGR
jgi:hypothetical protein